MDKQGKREKRRNDGRIMTRPADARKKSKHPVGARNEWESSCISCNSHP